MSWAPSLTNQPRTDPPPTISLRVRLMAALPLINLITGLVVAARTSQNGGGADHGGDVLVAVAVATTISLELTLLLSKSVLRPINDLREATERLKEGDYEISVPVTSGDELGELAASFNEMAVGLSERERIREAFGTYLDREVAEYILSEGFDARLVLGEHFSEVSLAEASPAADPVLTLERSAAPRVTIRHVLLVRTCAQVIGIHARWVVAGVESLRSGRR